MGPARAGAADGPRIAGGDARHGIYSNADGGWLAMHDASSPNHAVKQASDVTGNERVADGEVWTAAAAVRRTEGRL